MLEGARRSVVSIASTNQSSNARFILDMVFDAGFLVETGSMIDGYGREGGEKESLNK